jgi:uncharacterized protein
MIPQFPEFKKLELSDREEVEKFTSKYPPYADHNFLGSWSWDVHQKICISQLNGNYVMKFADYSTGEPFYTFLGNNKVNETAKALLDISKEDNIKPELKLIPEIAIEGIDANIFKIEEDRDNFDYIYDLKLLSELKGHQFLSQRNKVNLFLKHNPDYQEKRIFLNDESVKKEILGLYKIWIENKINKDPSFKSHKELFTIDRFLSESDEFNLIATGVYVKGALIAFCINELKDSEYAVSHVTKTHPLFNGSYAFLIQKSSEVLCSLGKKYLNYEQDVGLANLRATKMSFRPVFFLKKYILTYR